MKKVFFLSAILFVLFLLNGCEPTITSINVTFYFETNGGDPIDPIPLDGAINFQLPTPIREGYVFDGWFMDEALTIPAMITGIPKEIYTFYAKWKMIETYTITFITYNDSEIASLSYQEGAQITLPDGLEKTDHIFSGWYTDPEFTSLFELTLMPKSNITLYAKWSFIGVKIIFDTQGGSDISDIILAPNTPITAPLEPIREGYIFSGWFLSLDDITPYQFDLMPNNDIILYANWGSIGLSYELLISEDAYEVSIGDLEDAESIEIPKYYQGKPVTHIAETGFMNASHLTEIILPDTITHIKDRAFISASMLKSILLPKQLESIGISVFRFCYELEGIYVHGHNLYFDSVQGVLFSKDLKTLVRYPLAKKDKLYLIADYVETIGEDAFSGNHYLTNVTIGSGLKLIKTHAFYEVTSLISIHIPDHVTEIELYAFRDCFGLENVEIGSGLTSISAYMFNNCTKLASIVIPIQITFIGYGAFYGCFSLSSITILRPISLGMITGSTFMFASTSSDLIIYFNNQSTLDAYKLDYQWGTYQSKFQVS